MGSLAKTAPLATIARCSIIARAEDAADEAAIRQSMADPTISGKKIAAWIGCASSTVGEHRRIKCDDCCGGAA